MESSGSGVNIYCHRYSRSNRQLLSIQYRSFSDATYSEVRIVERVYREKPADKKLGGGLKDMPQCEHCGRPVKISSDDYTREEILCPHCASDARASEIAEYESAEV